MLAVGARSLEQVVLEHEGRHDVRSRDVEPVHERLGVDVALPQRERCVVLALAVGGQTPPRAHDCEHGVVRARLGPDDRQARVEAFDEALHGIRSLEPAIEHDRREARKSLARMRHEHGEQHFAAIAGDEHDGTLGEAGEHVLHRHAGDDGAQHFALQQRLVASLEGAPTRLHDRSDRGRDEVRVFGDGRHERLRCHRLHGGANGVERLDVGAVRDDAQQLRVLVIELSHGDLGDPAHVVGRARPRLGEPAPVGAAR